MKTFAVKSSSNAYDIIGDILHSGERELPSRRFSHVNDVVRSEHFPSPSFYNCIRDSGYETTSSSIERQRCLPPSSPSNVSLSPDGQLITVTYFSSSSSSSNPSHPDSCLSSSSSSSNTMSRTLRTFSSQMPAINATGNESVSMMSARLAEQEIIEV